ncbi:DUF983 domain-containing protein [Solitalea longa]|uniref:DUF983 domain-containing protein n=1 Tax=Solitalea longa TaxID=2079460 RepID=A0A2S5A051_9SPHI|nr:DUF983 domain-containing protein [Solitalea longa]POY35647.1 DUF983 domain-containing protein [Solitalea longa]
MAISKFQAIVQQKCPRCHQGNMFVHPSYNLIAYQKMHSNCPVCGLRFEIEPGFFWGGMYLSYALNVAQSVTLGIATYFLLGDPSPWVYLSIIIGAIFLFMPINFRYGRVLMLHWFSPIKFDTSYSK